MSDLRRFQNPRCNDKKVTCSPKRLNEPSTLHGVRTQKKNAAMKTLTSVSSSTGDYALALDRVRQLAVG